MVFLMFLFAFKREFGDRIKCIKLVFSSDCPCLVLKVILAFIFILVATKTKTLMAILIHKFFRGVVSYFEQLSKDDIVSPCITKNSF